MYCVNMERSTKAQFVRANLIIITQDHGELLAISSHVESAQNARLCRPRICVASKASVTKVSTFASPFPA
jgi:hypothetical protein